MTVGGIKAFAFTDVSWLLLLLMLLFTNNLAGSGGDQSRGFLTTRPLVPWHRQNRAHWFCALCHPVRGLWFVSTDSSEENPACHGGVWFWDPLLPCKPLHLRWVWGPGIFLPQANGSLGGAEGADAQHCLLLPPCQPTAHLLGNQPQAEADVAGGAC